MKESYLLEHVGPPGRRQVGRQIGQVSRGRAVGGEGRVRGHLHPLHHLLGDGGPERLEEAEEGGHAAELVKTAVHQVVRVDEAGGEQTRGLQGLQHCWDPTSWWPLKRESVKGKTSRKHLQGGSKRSRSDIVVKSEATQGQTVRPLAA